MTKKEHSIGFLQWVIDNLCICGIDTFFHPDDMDKDLTADDAYKLYEKSNHKNA